MRYRAGMRATNEELATEFADWSEHAADSPIYRNLSLAVSTDPEVLEVVSRVKGVPRPNVFLAAVHLLVQPDDALAAWYPSRSPDPLPVDSRLFGVFKAFVLEHQTEIVEIGSVRLTQTNEVGRCSVLVPFLPTEHEMIHVIELGSAAGLNLCFDRFGYRYSTGERLGQGTPTLACENLAGVAIPPVLPEVGVRIGIDLHPIDLTVSAERAWLEALIWPDQRERRMRFLEAAAIRRTIHVRDIRGDVVEKLPEAASLVPAEGHLVILHSMMFALSDQDHRGRIDEAVREIAGRRPLTRIGLEFWDGRKTSVRRAEGIEEMEHMVDAHHHGAWMKA